jgi:hypothetical protein
MPVSLTLATQFCASENTFVTVCHGVDISQGQGEEFTIFSSFFFNFFILKRFLKLTQKFIDGNHVMLQSIHYEIFKSSYTSIQNPFS